MAEKLERRERSLIERDHTLIAPVAAETRQAGGQATLPRAIHNRPRGRPIMRHVHVDLPIFPGQCARGPAGIDESHRPIDPDAMRFRPHADFEAGRARPSPQFRHRGSRR